MYFRGSFHRVRIKNGPGFLPRPNFFYLPERIKNIIIRRQFFQIDTHYQKNILIHVAR